MLIVTVASLLAHAPVAAQSRFQGSILLEPLPDGRNMKLLGPFAFIDTKGRVWEVPAGAPDATGAAGSRGPAGRCWTP